MAEPDRVEREIEVLRQVYLLLRSLSLQSRGRVLDYLGEVGAPGYPEPEEPVL